MSCHKMKVTIIITFRMKRVEKNLIIINLNLIDKITST